MIRFSHPLRRVKALFAAATFAATGLGTARAAAQTPAAPGVPPETASATLAPSAPPVNESPLTGVEARPVKFDIGAATELPIMTLGVTTLLEVPYGIQIRADLGWLGSPYTDAINSFLNGIGAYGSGQVATSTSEIVLAALHNSLVVRAGAGWRPFARHGFEFFAGYTLVSLGGTLSGKDAITAVTGMSFPAQDQSVDATIKSTLHNFNVGVGWRWLFLNDHVVLRASGEYLQTVASSTSLSFATSQGAKDAPNISAALNSYLDNIYKTYVKTPVVSVGLAYRF